MNIYGVRRFTAALSRRFIAALTALLPHGAKAPPESGAKAPHSITHLTFIFALLSSSLLAFALDPLMDEGFVDGIKTVSFDEGQFVLPIPHPDMLEIDSLNSGIPDAVKKLAGYPLDVDTSTLLGGISLRDRYKMGLSITREDSDGDGISDWDKIRPPGWNNKNPYSPVYFTMEENDDASATPFEPGDFIFTPPINEYVTDAWDDMTVAFTNFCFPLGEHYHTGIVHIAKWGSFEFIKPVQNNFSEKLPTPELSGDAVAVAWCGWRPVPRTNAVIVAGFRGEHRGQRYFFTRWEKMKYARRPPTFPTVTFEGRLFEDGRIEIHYLDGDFSLHNEVYSGAQCFRAKTGLTVPLEKMVPGKKITLHQHYALGIGLYSIAGDDIADAWKVRNKINPHARDVADMIFNDEGLTLRECFEQQRSPWTIIPEVEP